MSGRKDAERIFGNHIALIIFGNQIDLKIFGNHIDFKIFGNQKQCLLLTMTRKFNTNKSREQTNRSAFVFARKLISKYLI